MDKKIDKLLTSTKALSDSQKQSQAELKDRMDQLEREVTTSNKESTQWVVKRLKRARSYEFKQKGDEKKFDFNEEVKEDASAHIAKLPREMQEHPSLVSATEELKEGMKVLHTRQKLIWLADRSELGWAVVDAYESDELASDDEDAKRMKEAKKVVNQKDQKERKKKQVAVQKRGRPAVSGWWGPPALPKQPVIGELNTANAANGQSDPGRLDPASTAWRSDISRHIVSRETESILWIN